MGCCSCKFLVEKNKLEGKVSGGLYYCSKLDTYVNCYTGMCNDYCRESGRKTYVCDEIYADGKKYYNDTTPVGFYAIVLIMMIILGTVLGVFNL